jgi:hypothetical protein
MSGFFRTLFFHKNSMLQHCNLRQWNKADRCLWPLGVCVHTTAPTAETGVTDATRECNAAQAAKIMKTCQTSPDMAVFIHFMSLLLSRKFASIGTFVSL